MGPNVLSVQFAASRGRRFDIRILSFFCHSSFVILPASFVISISIPSIVSKKINTTTIGLFIVTGVALGVSGLLLFSSSKLFRNTRDIIVYFDESLSGLSQGAAVKYRGVTIGSVKRVMVQFNQATNDYNMPVLLELEEKLLRERMPSLINFRNASSARFLRSIC